jgi:hypothetical protein
MLDLPPGRHSLQLVFKTPLEISVGRAATFITLLLMILLGLRRKGRATLWP